MLTRQLGEWAPGMQEDGAQAQPHSSGPRMDTEDAGPHLDKGKDIMNRRKYTGDKVPAALSELKTLCADQAMDISTKIGLCIKQHAGNSNQRSQRNYIQLHHGLLKAIHQGPLNTMRPIMYIRPKPWAGVTIAGAHLKNIYLKQPDVITWF